MLLDVGFIILGIIITTITPFMLEVNFMLGILIVTRAECWILYYLMLGLGACLNWPAHSLLN